tara:strand:- start:61 stop:864 length:804 start_codon:yes stop_codon:yes gene_type:complete
MNQLFDRNVIIKSKNKASENWDDHNFLYKSISNILHEKIDELKENFNNVLFLSTDCFELIKINKLKFKQTIIASEYIQLLKKVNFKQKNIYKITTSFEDLSFSNGHFDLIIVNLCLHKINNIQKFCSSLMSLLKEKGLLICTYFGGKTLIELRNSFLIADDRLNKKSYQRIIPLIDMIDATNLFQRAGFKEIVSDSTNFQIKYNSIMKLLYDIQGMGENNCLSKRYKGLFSRLYLKATEKEYIRNFSDKSGDLNVTCDLVTLVMWKN